MKRLLVPIAFCALVVAVHGQAYVNFNNRTLAPSDPGQSRVIAPVYGVNPLNPTGRLSGNATTNGGSTDYTGVPMLFGAGFTASLWAAPVPQGLQPQVVVPPAFELLGTTTFRTMATLGGFWSNTNATLLVPFVNQVNQPVLFQVRVWDNAGGTLSTWASALASGNTALGYSDVITVTTHFDPGFPLPPVDLFGLQSFNLSVVPEPSLLAFGLLTSVLGAAIWRSRK